MVSAGASPQSLTLGQVKTEEKSNEITAVPQLLELLELHGCVVFEGAEALGFDGAPCDYIQTTQRRRGRELPA